MKILIVEDNEIHLKLMHFILQVGGHEVLDASSAEQATQILQENTPQVIVTDLELPNMDGMTLTRRLKQTPKTANIPVIAVTAYPEHFSRRAAQEAGCAAYFVKPINTRTLSQQVAKVVNRT